MHWSMIYNKYCNILKKKKKEIISLDLYSDFKQLRVQYRLKSPSGGCSKIKSLGKL